MLAEMLCPAVKVRWPSRSSSQVVAGIREAESSRPLWVLTLTPVTLRFLPSGAACAEPASDSARAAAAAANAKRPIIFASPFHAESPLHRLNGPAARFKAF